VEQGLSPFVVRFIDYSGTGPWTRAESGEKSIGSIGRRKCQVRRDITSLADGKDVPWYTEVLEEREKPAIGSCGMAAWAGAAH
jgi:hypothetical protein